MQTSEELMSHAEKARFIDEVLGNVSVGEIELGQQLSELTRTYEQEDRPVEFSKQVEAIEVRAIERISKAFEELLDNAYRHAPEENPAVSVELRRKNGYAVVVVEDDNPPIVDGDRRVLTGDVKTTALDHGSGVGLWLVRWLVDRSHGQIEYESPGERGNQIRVKLPENTD